MENIRCVDCKWLHGNTAKVSCEAPKPWILIGPGNQMTNSLLLFIYHDCPLYEDRENGMVNLLQAQLAAALLDNERLQKEGGHE